MVLKTALQLRSVTTKSHQMYPESQQHLAPHIRNIFEKRRQHNCSVLTSMNCGDGFMAGLCHGGQTGCCLWSGCSEAVANRSGMVSAKQVIENKVNFMQKEFSKFCRKKAHSQVCNHHFIRRQHHFNTAPSQHSTLLKHLFFFLLALSLLTITRAGSNLHITEQRNTQSSSFVWTIEDLGTEAHSRQIDSRGIPDMVARVGRLFWYQVSQDAFEGRHVESYKATQAGTHYLPSWLSFDPTTAVFTGVPLPSDVGKVYIKVEAKLESGSKRENSVVSEFFVMQVQSASDANVEHLKAGKSSFGLKSENAECDIPLHCTNPQTEEISANLVVLVNFTSLSSHQRASLFTTVSQFLRICPEALSLREIDWASREGVVLWSQLVDADSLEYVSSASILSYRVACSLSDLDFEDGHQSVFFDILEDSVAMYKDGLPVSDDNDGELILVYDQWFLSAGNTLIIQSKVKSNHRVRRQIESIDDGPFGISGFNPPNNDASTSPTSTSTQTATTGIVAPTFTSSSLITAPPTRVIPTSEASRGVPMPPASVESLMPTSTTTLETAEIFLPPTSAPVMIMSSVELSTFTTTAIQVIETTTPSFSFSVPSSIEVITPTSSVIPSTAASPTFLVSSSILEPLTSAPVFSLMTSAPVFTVLPTSTNILLPMPTSQLTLSLSVFTPSSFFELPSSTPLQTPETTTLASSSEIFVEPTTTVQFSLTPSLSVFSSSEVALPTSIFTPIAITSVELSTDLVLTSSFIEPTSTLVPSVTSVAFTTSSITLQTTLIVSIVPSETIFPFTSSVILEPTSAIFSETFFPFSSSVVIETTTSALPVSSLEPTPTPALSTTALPSSVIPSLSLEESAPLTTMLSSSALPTSIVSPVLTSTILPILTPSSTPSPTPAARCGSINCNNGTCVDIFNSFICLCFAGWTGEFCDVDIDFCIPPPLGPCDSLGAESCIENNSTYQCSCLLGYTGQNCTMDIDECAVNPCQNGGNCSNFMNGVFVCECLPDFTGPLCESDATPCDPFPCVRGEICLDLGPGNFSCQASIETSSQLIETTATSAASSPAIVPTSAIVATSVVVPTSVIVATSAIVPTSVIVATSVVVPTSVMSSTDGLETSSTVMDSTLSTTETISSQITSLAVLISSLTTTVQVIESTTPSFSIPSSIEVVTPTFSTSVPTPSPSPTPPPANTSPLLLNPIGTLRVNEGQVFTFEIPEETFFDFEDGGTSSLRLTLLESDGSLISDLSWVQLRGQLLEALPLTAQVAFNAVTEYRFVLRAEDSGGAVTHDIVTVQIIPRLPDIENFLAVFLEGNFESFNRNLSAKIQVIERLSAVPNPLGPQDTSFLYVNAFRSGSISVSYSNLTIPDSNCADFRVWVATIFTNGNYTPNFYQALSPFIPTSMPVIEGPCNVTSTNPTVGQTPETIDPNFQSELRILLAAIIPTALVALLVVCATLLGFGLYRRRRTEREDLLRTERDRHTFLNRPPIIFDGEADLPNRGGPPAILPGEFAARRAAAQDREREQLLEEIDANLSESSDEEDPMLPLLVPYYDPPPYQLPPDYVPRARLD